MVKKAKARCHWCNLPLTAAEEEKQKQPPFVCSACAQLSVGQATRRRAKMMKAK